MAHKKAVKEYRYNKCSKDAKRIAEKWFNNSNMNINAGSIYIVWLAFTKNGYRCMITSNQYKDIFFEINKNFLNNEMICHVLKQVECIIHPSQSEPIIMHDRITTSKE